VPHGLRRSRTGADVAEYRQMDTHYSAIMTIFFQKKSNAPTPNAFKAGIQNPEKAGSGKRTGRA
jgi:hypothetical protein